MNLRELADCIEKGMSIKDIQPVPGFLGFMGAQTNPPSADVWDLVLAGYFGSHEEGNRQYFRSGCGNRIHFISGALKLDFHEAAILEEQCQKMPLKQLISVLRSGELPGKTNMDWKQWLILDRNGNILPIKEERPRDAQPKYKNNPYTPWYRNYEHLHVEEKRIVGIHAKGSQKSLHKILNLCLKHEAELMKVYYQYDPDLVDVLKYLAFHDLT